jgi:hypothetical protein
VFQLLFARWLSLSPFASKTLAPFWRIVFLHLGGASLVLGTLGAMRGDHVHGQPKRNGLIADGANHRLRLNGLLSRQSPSGGHFVHDCIGPDQSEKKRRLIPAAQGCLKLRNFGLATRVAPRRATAPRHQNPNLQAQTNLRDQPLRDTSLGLMETMASLAAEICPRSG